MTFAGYESPIQVILNFITLERFPAQRERKNMFMILSSWLKIFYVPNLLWKNRIYLAKFI